MHVCSSSRFGYHYGACLETKNIIKFMSNQKHTAKILDSLIIEINAYFPNIAAELTKQKNSELKLITIKEDNILIFACQ